MSASAERGEAAWLSQRERGTVAALRLATIWATLLGRRLSRPMVHLIALYYALFDKEVKRVSRAWFTRLTGEAPTFSRVYRHILTFVQVTLDRLYFTSGRVAPFAITRTGNQHLLAQARSGQGAILLGAHVGSFEAMRASGGDERMPISIVGTWENAKMINALLSSFDPEMPAQVVHTGGDPVSLALTLRERIAEGHLLAMMADRVGPNEKTVEVDFFGEKASFAAGPFLLASVLKCPVFIVFGIYTEPNRYDLYCEPFAEKIVLPRGDREAGLEKAVTEYAARLESYARRAPENWFNFFDFWEKPTR
ncbi:MAG: lipid A biosynthesis acyltransferase [Myxococcota bacterium]